MRSLMPMTLTRTLLAIRAALLAALLALGFTFAAGTTPAEANASCSSGYLCMYPCYLSGSCSYEWRIYGGTTGCIAINATDIYSVKNNSSYRFMVFHDSYCSGGADSYFYAHTSGDMNWEWAGSGIGSVKRG